MQFALNPSSSMRGAHRSTRLSRPSHCPHRPHVTLISIPGQLASQPIAALHPLTLGYYLLHIAAEGYLVNSGCDPP